MTLRTQTVSILTPGSVEDRGTDLPDWDDPTTTTESGWRVQPAGGNEVHAGDRQAVVRLARGFGPADSAITSACRLVYGGVTYEVDGPVESWPSASGGLAHIEVSLKEVAG